MATSTTDPLFLQNFERSKRLIQKKYDDIYKKRAELEQLRFHSEAYDQDLLVRIKTLLEDLERFEIELALLQQENYDEWQNELKLDQIGVVASLPNYKEALRTPKRPSSMKFRPKMKSKSFDLNDPSTSVVSPVTLSPESDQSRKRSQSYVGLPGYKFKSNVYEKMEVSQSQETPQVQARRRALTSNHEILYNNMPDSKSTQLIREELHSSRLELAKLLGKKSTTAIEDAKIKQLQGVVRDCEDRLKKISRMNYSSAGILL